ncbi:MAG: hypothetical protein HYZ28_18610 [Myxococcales bacterium]|nr:hypothetical protein [Myxococcales bacterium]
MRKLSRKVMDGSRSLEMTEALAMVLQGKDGTRVQTTSEGPSSAAREGR